jgi:type IV pilus assembly protein PilV
VSLVIRPRGRQIRQEGFTLIEVMIALLLLLIGVAGVLSMQMTSMKATSFSRHATEATIVAEDRMEELMIMTTDQLLLLHLSSDDVNAMAVDTPATDEYTRTLTVVDSLITADVLDVRVEVTWLERGTESHSVIFNTQRRP